jgi:AraC family transcriptional regulator
VNAPVAAELLQSISLPLTERNGNAAAMAGAVARLLRAGLKALETDREAAADIFAKACTVLEVAAATDGLSDQAARATVPGGLTPWQVQRIKAYVDDNLDGNVSVAKLADVAHLGPSHFRRAFKKSLGVSPHGFVVERRIWRAQELMVGTDQSLSEIALQVGFADQAHLTTRFHRMVGKTPGAWRRERGAGDNRRKARDGMFCDAVFGAAGNRAA